MKKIKTLLVLVVTLGYFSGTGISQSIQKFGPGVHEDLDHRIDLRRICVPNPTKDVSYNFDKSFAKNVNDAIKRERSAFSNSKIGNYLHPKHYTDPVDYAAKIITALRRAYSQAYNIKVVDIPLNTGVNNAAQNHACKMISCNQFTHQSSCTGSPKSRLEAQVGSWGSCLNGYSENIAINTSRTVEGAIEWAIFGMMYDDLACCNNGHRENFLKCTYDSNWRMGFGYKKGKYSFGSSRSYDTWFMVWDYAKIGRSSGCGWDDDKGARNCSSMPEVAINNLRVNGQSNCSSLKASWTASNTNQVQKFEVYQSTNGKSYSQVATVSPNSGNNYSASFNTSGSEAKIYIKAITKNGSFKSSKLFVFDVGDCSPGDNTSQPDNNNDEDGSNDDGEDVTDNNNPPAPKPNPEPEPEPENDPTKIVVSPNPATNFIKLGNVPYGKLYFIRTMQGRFVMVGFYRSEIQISRLQPGTYVITADNKTGKFVKL